MFFVHEAQLVDSDEHGDSVAAAPAARVNLLKDRRENWVIGETPCSDDWRMESGLWARAHAIPR